MALELDTRQRAMLKEMGVRVWLPGTEFAVVDVAPAHAGAPSTAPAPAAPRAVQAPVAAPAYPRAAPSAAAPSAPPAQAPTPAQTPTQTPTTVPASAFARTPPAPAVAASVELGELATADWSALQQAASHCQACGLCAGRKNSTLYPAASPADWMVVGDPPDAHEDADATPFADQSGVLLDNMLKAVGLRRNNGAEAVADAAHSAYVTNVVKCRPPHGAIPQATELAQCAAYLQREIALVQPKIILAMGRFANQLLLGETPALATQPLGKLRGALHHYQGIAVVVTYHPKGLLRNSADKAKAWADLCLAADTVDAQRSPSH